MTIPDSLSVITDYSKSAYLIKKYSDIDEMEFTVGYTEDEELANKIVKEMNDFIKNVQLPISFETWDWIINNDPECNKDFTIDVDSLYATALSIEPTITREQVQFMAAINDIEYDILQEYFYYVEEVTKLG